MGGLEASAGQTIYSLVTLPISLISLFPLLSLTLSLSPLRLSTSAVSYWSSLSLFVSTHQRWRSRYDFASSTVEIDFVDKMEKWRKKRRRAPYGSATATSPPLSLSLSLSHLHLFHTIESSLFAKVQSSDGEGKIGDDRYDQTETMTI
ncbi:unnamed protein product [Camellia sinensis]